MRTIPLAALLVTVLTPAAVEAANTGFDPRIITFGETRQELKATPITARPYRPLHVYGNSVRRRHQRAAPPPGLPASRR